MKANAVNFVNRFSEGRDNVGLVTFASSSRDDFPIASNFQSASPNVVSIINSVTCAGATNSAQCLWQGYTQLVALNQPGALNVVLFFTDGQPTAFTGRFRIKSLSTCVDKQTRTAALSVSGNGVNPAVSNLGLLSYMARAQPLANDISISPNSTGCAFAANWPFTASLVATDVDALPKTDIYGNPLITGYQPVNGGSPISDILSAVIPIDEASTAGLTPTNIYHAAVNAADSAGLRIRNGARVAALNRGLAGVVIFGIGLGNAGAGIEQDFMKRVTNDPDGSSYDPQLPAELFVYAPQAQDLTQAFNRVASEILRLAR